MRHVHQNHYSENAAGQNFRHFSCHAVTRAATDTMRQFRGLTLLLVLTVTGSILAALLPPLVLERLINSLTGNRALSLSMVLGYFLLLSLSGLLDAGKESLITIFGQKVTHRIRSLMCRKLSRLPADYYTAQDTGTTVSRFVSDVDTVETLFTSGIISMIADVFRIISILAVILFKSPGLALLLVLVLPLLFLLTRVFQKRMLAAQLDNRRAVGYANNHIPDTLRSIRMVRNLKKESYMEQRYGEFIQEGFRAVNRSNFYDAVYSPIIVTVSALITAVMMVLSSRGGSAMTFFGMSVGTSVALISYVGKIFDPLESLGMEIQNIQSAAAGIRRINEFLSEKERNNVPFETKEQTAGTDTSESKNTFVQTDSDLPAIRLRNVCFGYESGKEVLHNLDLTVEQGGHVTMTGRTGIGKSTVFKLLLGLYEPWSGSIEINGIPADSVPDSDRRTIFGYVEQSFREVPGSILDQIVMGDPNITREQAEHALKTVGLLDTVSEFKDGLDTDFSPSLFSQGQIQLLSIARAIAADPQILLLDEITANLDSETERTVLDALQSASKNRTMLSVSHRFSAYSKERQTVVNFS